LLAKLYLNAKVFTGEDHWQDCIDACNAILNPDKYSLDQNWNDPFRVHNEESNENIFVVPFDASNAAQFNFIEQNFHENILFAKYGVEYYGWHKISTQESFYDLYKPDDRRINQWAVGLQTYKDENGDDQSVLMWDGETPMDVTPNIDMLINYDGGEAQGAMNMKYEVEYGGLENMNNDMVVFRLADIMMMKAECLMRLNGNVATQEAVDLVNAVRARSFASGDPDARYTQASLTMNELLDERGREFAYEMHRREDLIRFDKFTDAWWEKPVSDETHEIYPVPFDIVTANPSLTQNPGY
jgi:starch-binding outer membrane protein, SusD/RagB family